MKLRVPWFRMAWISAIALTTIVSGPASAKEKKKGPPRGMLESMQSVPCGIKEHGLTGLGSIWASAGVTHVNSDEKLCPQYLFRTDEMDYHIRPADLKHAVLLPVGQEGVFKIKKNRMFLKFPDGDKKTRQFQVISMEPKKPSSGIESTSYTAHAPADYQRPPEYPTNRQTITPPSSAPPPQ